MNNFVFHTQPYDHQNTALAQSYGNEAFGFFMDMGTGKSKVVIDEIANLYLIGEIDSAFITANKGSYLNWEELNFPAHLLPEIKLKVITWDNARFLKQSQEVHKPFDGLSIFVMNVEALAFEKAEIIAESFIKAHKNCYMAVDESTTIKNRDAKRTKAVIALGKFCKYRRIMTGDPVTRNPLDLWSQCEFLKPGLLGHKSFFTFRAAYANVINMNAGVRTFKKVIGFKNLDELTELIKTFSFRIKKEQCLDLPPKVYQTRFVELTAEQKRVYEELKNEAIAFLKDEISVSATLVLTRLLRLHQIVCGHMKDDTGITHNLPNNRINALMELLEETEGKVIIWATYTRDIETIKEHLAKVYGHDAVVTYYGATKDDERKQAVNQFQDNGSPVRFFVGNPSTGGFGITLTAASTEVYYSNSYDLEERAQSEDRAHRIGQKNTVNIVDLVTKNTVDEKILKALKDKRKVAAHVMGDEWKEWF